MAIEVKGIVVDSKKQTPKDGVVMADKRVKFVKGAVVADKGVGEALAKQDEEALIALSVEAVIADNVKTAIDDDNAALRNYEKCMCGPGCADKTGIPHVPTVVVTKARQKVFDSGLKVVNVHNEKIKINIPRGILNICDEIQRSFERLEFSIVCKGKWGDDGEYIIEDGYDVPKQKVDGAAVDYDLDHLEQLKLEGYNTVIHSHPFKSNSFSSSDQETINSHFECSILYSLREFTTATIAVIPAPGMKLIITGEPSIEGENIVPKSQMDKIEKKYGQVKYYNGNFGNGNFGNNFAGDFERFPSARGRGCQGHQIHNERDIPTRDRTVQGGHVYTYDRVNDMYFKDGVMTSKYGHPLAEYEFDHGRVSRGAQPVRVSNGDVEVRQIPGRIFTAVEQTKVFHTEGSKNHMEGKKNKGGKRENLPKIDTDDFLS